MLHIHKQQKIPEIEEGVQKLLHWIEMDKMIRKLKDQDSKNFWKKIKDYVENNWDMKGKKNAPYIFSP